MDAPAQHLTLSDSAADFLTGGGQMASMMRAHDWSDSALGDPENWPQSLRAVVALMINSRYPMFIAWGPQLSFLYNDGYAPIFGAKHPHMLGRPFREAWSEIWDDLEPLVNRALAGEATFNEDLHLVMERNGYPEDTWYSFSYSPVRDESGGVAGLFCACTETTQRVLAERRLSEAMQRQLRLFEKAPSFVAVLNGPNHVFDFANDAYFRLVNDRDVVGKPVIEALPEVVGQGFIELLDDVYKTGKRVVSARTPITLQSGSQGATEQMFVDFVYEPIHDETGRVTGIFVQGHNVTAQTRTEVALAKSDARFRFFDALSKATQAETDPEAVMAAATRLLGEHLGVDICPYADVEADSDIFHIRRDWTSPGIPSIVGTYSLNDFGTVAAHAQRSGIPLVTRNAIADLGEEQASAFTSIGIAATICVPLVKHGRLAAMMAVHSAHPRDWSDDEVGLVAEVAERCWAHIERIAANAALRDSEQRFRDQFENANDFIFTTDLEMRITSCNPAVAQALERTPEQLLGRRISEFTPPETWEYNKAMLAAKLDGKGDASRYEVEVFTLAGERMTWEINSRLTRDPGGVPTGLHAIGRDVTERNRAAKLLDDARIKAEADAAQQTAVLGQLAEGVIITDATGQIIFVNEAATRLHGVDKLGVSPSEYSQTYHLFQEDGSPYPFEELPLTRAILCGDIITDARWVIQRSDGSEVLAIGNAQPVIGADGRAIGAVLTVRDDTARHAAETALRDFNATLETRVAERSAELEEAQEALRQSQKLEAMGQLTGGVAHDFNNLLTPIIGSLDMLQRKQVGGPREQMLIDGALQSADRAKTLVQRLLAFARRQPLRPTAVNIEQLVHGMGSLIASTCGPHIRLQFDIEAGLPLAKGDANQLEMALLNLSVNARDAMPQYGMLKISAGLDEICPGHRTGLPAGDYIRLGVADNGCGMDRDTLVRSVEPFFSTKGIGKGTGLGLSMVHGLARQLGGNMLITSQLGEGTLIEIWLPLSEEQGASADSGPANLELAQSSGTVLLVDDETIVRASTADMLAELGYDVVEAGSAEEALQLLEGLPHVDLLVTDHLMPGMTGAKLAEMFGHLRPSVPVVIATGYAEADGIPGELPRLNKPFRQSELAAILKDLDIAGEVEPVR